MSLQCKLAASSTHGDFEACVNLLQTCFTFALLSCQLCCKLADLQCKSAANLLQTKIASWVVANLTRGDFEACVNVLQTCFNLALLSCQICSKLADLQSKIAATFLQTKITIWVCNINSSISMDAFAVLFTYIKNLDFICITFGLPL
ncbi:hypothetical protein AVEN_213335-1 [Araneus ventricosus]|uniref:Uncharacterized protein n=1 Tax=Araneus ventricosus TaxID=182803 RepID=A0A4Y2IC85_ARAVE|nr:hypothetical protein AVEN_213335-1 [Araneus ventricosus]